MKRRNAAWNLFDVCASVSDHEEPVATVSNNRLVAIVPNLRVYSSQQLPDEASTEAVCSRSATKLWLST